MASTVATKKRPAEAPDASVKKARFLENNSTNEGAAFALPTPCFRISTPHDSGTTTPVSPQQTEASVADTGITSASGLKRVKKFFCDYDGCNKAFDRPVRLQTHIRSHTGERPFVCTEDGCDKAFPRVEHLKAHLKAKHTEDRNYVCDYTIVVGGVEQECGKGFHTGTRLRRHVAAHEEKEGTRCSEPGCGKVFRKQETLQRHIMKEHMDEMPYRCAHAVLVAAEGVEPEECGERFSTATQLKRHESRVHIGKRYECELCPPAAETISFPSWPELQAHQKVEHPPTCADCGVVCESNKALRAHMDIAHTSLDERKKFPCTHPGCSRSFTKKGNMQVHVQTVHVKAKTFTCGEYILQSNKKVEGWDGKGCGFSFGTKANLEDHIRSQHLRIPQSIRPSVLKKKVKREQEDMDTDFSTPHIMEVDTTVSLVTGGGYSDHRPIACLVPGCQARYKRDYDLGQHLELTHGWHVDDAKDAIVERNARESGQFWLGGENGGDGMDDFGGAGSDHSGLGQRLQDALALESQFDGVNDAIAPGVTNCSGDTEQMPVDPALAEV